MSKKGRGWHGNSPGHRLAAYGITSRNARIDRNAPGGVHITMEAAERAAKSLIDTPNEWENWGDANFDKYGGTAVRRDNSGVEIVEVTPLTEIAGRDEIVQELLRHGSFDTQEEAFEWLDEGNTPYYYQRDQLDYEDLANVANSRGVLNFVGADNERDPKKRVQYAITGYIPYFGGNLLKFAKTLDDVGLEGF